MPKRPRSRQRPPARKKARRRLDMPVVAAPRPDSRPATHGPAPARVIPFPGAREASLSRAAARAAHADFSYVKREIRRIALLAAAMLALLIVLSFFLG